MAVQLAHTGSGDTSHRAVTAGVNNGAVAWYLFSCATQSTLCAAGAMVVLRVVGEIDLGAAPVVQAALGRASPRTRFISSRIWPR
ncbi:MAG TPA: hypothetical protein VHY21_08760 [Pseudonocardiaceae bacterium]|nr:hypothetical protein [Pseudonocardiaceae bacterium]